MDPVLASLPFLHRKQLDFDFGTTFGINITVRSTTAAQMYLVGATKSGPFTMAFVTAGNKQGETFTFEVGDLPIWVSVLDLDGNFQQGDAHANMQLLVNNDQLYMLSAGYINNNGGVSWPVSHNERSTPNIGLILTLTGTDPAANVEIDEQPAAGVVSLIKCLRFTLVTDANAATRQVHLQLVDNTDVVMDLPAAATQAASLTRQYTFAAANSNLSAAAGTEIFTCLPANMVWRNAMHIRTVTDNRQVTDNFGAPKIHIEQFYFT